MNAAEQRLQQVAMIMAIMTTEELGAIACTAVDMMSFQTGKKQEEVIQKIKSIVEKTNQQDGPMCQ